MKIRVLGDSHGKALLDAWEAIADPRVDFAVQTANAKLLHRPPVFWRERPGRVVIVKPLLAARVREVLGSNFLEPDGTLYGLCMGMNSVVSFNPLDWRRFAPWNIAEEVGGMPVSQAAMEAFFLEKSKFIFGFYDALRNAGIPFFVISGPPPRRGHRVIRQGTQPRVVAEVTRTYKAFVMRHLKERSYRFVDVPAEAADADGFMKPEFEFHSTSGKDYQHGNVEYGKLYLRKIFAALQPAVSAETRDSAVM